MQLTLRFFYLFIVISSFANAQIRGLITDEINRPMPFVNIYIENSYIGTTSNDKGQYELQLKPGKYTVVYQSIGFKTQKKEITLGSAAVVIDVRMVEEQYQLQEVVVNANENPAHPIIRQAIANRKKNRDKIQRYTSDFYSKGKFKLKNLPKKFMGVEVDADEMLLDSTRSGIIYLSETVSKITFERPNKLKEHIVASKISGDNNGFSFNTALNANFEFYENTIDFGIPMVSPIADQAFGTYAYTLEGTFYDDYGHLINKIKIKPKRTQDPAYDGHIYIIEDSWEIYAVDFQWPGARMRQDLVNEMRLTQNYSYNPTNQLWSKSTQSLQIDAGMFGIGFEGAFTYVFSNYDFPAQFEKKTFGREVVSFAQEANKKDSLYWQNFRPVPLAQDELIDYKRKDSVEVLRSSKTYLDSIDRKSNKFKWTSPIKGYTYRNSYQKTSFTYDGFFKLPMFNTVQGWTTSTGFSARFRENDDRRAYTSVSASIQYGFADERVRPTAQITRRFAGINNAFLRVSGGNTVAQFNASNPITPLVNSISSLVFRDNYMKLYEKNYAQLSYQQEAFNGLYFWSSLEWAERNPLFNETDFSWRKADKAYTSNHPLLPEAFDAALPNSERLMTFRLTGRFRFAQKYISRPDGKFNIRDDRYPTLYVNYTKGFGGSDKALHYDYVNARAYYDKTFGNKGTLYLNTSAGMFFNNDQMSFVDFKHFNGNQTQVNNGGTNVNSFLLLPYYMLSTTENYMESHAEHHFNGFIMNRLPLLKHLKSTLVIGHHIAAIEGQAPYQEFSVGLDRLGFGKFKVFRIDYVRSYQGTNFNTDGIMFGLKFLDVLNRF